MSTSDEPREFRCDCSPGDARNGIHKIGCEFRHHCLDEPRKSLSRAELRIRAVEILESAERARIPASDEPHVVTRTQVEQERDAYKALAGECPNEPLFFVLAAVLAEVAEVARQEGDGVLLLPEGEYATAIYRAATYIREALRIKAGGA